MPRRTIVISALVLIVGLGIFALAMLNSQPQVPTDYRSVVFWMSGEPVALTDGYAETEMTLGQAGKSEVRYFGNEAKGDLDGDGIVDLVFLITQETSAGEVLYYLVGALQSADGTYRGTHAVLIGDDIAPQTAEFHDGLVIVNYADRLPAKAGAAGKPQSTRPSAGKSLYLKYDSVRMDFGEVVQNFEGEADIKAISL